MATGLSGGDGHDTLENFNAINVSSSAKTVGLSVTADLAGAGFDGAATTARSFVTGMSGEAGDDTMKNSGILTLTTDAEVDQSSVSARLIGYSDSDGSSVADASPV
jgi:hypothetical protein